ncbi:Hypothetical protein Cul05146_1422 [Corynebacterium ulcerans]|nr:Hypothetical protein Cul05146_1422 [Corynebacterium ulcerans]
MSANAIILPALSKRKLTPYYPQQTSLSDLHDKRRRENGADSQH